MRKLLATTSMSLTLAGAAFAQSGTGMDQSGETSIGAETGVAVEETWDKTKDAAADAYDATKEAAGTVAEDVAEAYDEMTHDLKELMTSSAQQGYVVVSPEVVIAAEIEGQPVYDMENNHIGEVASVETDPRGQVEAATIEIGGFLGIGEAEVDVDATEMGVVRNDKSDVRVYVAATEDELEQRAEMSNS